MRTVIKRFWPAFVLGMFGGMAGAKAMHDERGKTQHDKKRKGKSKGGSGVGGFIAKTPRPHTRGTPLGNAIILYFENGKPKYGRPDIEGMRELMDKNWHRTFMGRK